MNTTETHSPLFYKYQERYNRGGCTVAQLYKLQELGVLKDWEVQEIINPEGPEPNEVVE